MTTSTITKNKSPWVICLSASLFFFFAFLQLNLLNSMSTELLSTFSITEIKLGELSASYFLGLGLFFIPAGLLLDYFSTRRLILIAMIIEIITVMLFALSPNYHVAIIARFISGCIHAIAFLSCIRLTSRWLAHRIGFAIGLIITIGLCGGIIAQMPMVKLVSSIGWRESVELLTVVGILILFLQWLFVIDYPNKPQTSYELKFSKSIYYVILNKQNWLCAAYTALLNLPVIILGATWGNIFLTNEHNITKSQAAFILSMIYIGNIMSSPLIGWISDKLKKRKVVMIAGAILALLIVLPVAFVNTLSLSVLAVLFFLLGFIISAQSISYPTISESNLISYTGLALGFASSIIRGSAIIFQPLFGWLIEKNWQITIFNTTVNHYRIAFFIIPIAFLLSLTCAFFIKETHCMNQQRPDFRKKNMLRSLKNLLPH